MCNVQRVSMHLYLNKHEVIGIKNKVVSIRLIILI